MTQRSLPWDGHVLGDATLAPYSATEWDDLYESLFGSLADCGVIPGIEGELEVTGATSPVSVDTGRALVLGKFFENNSATTLTINSPITSPRRDWIVLRCCWGTAGTCADALHAGTGEVSGPRKIRICHKMNPVEDLTPPALEQSDGNIWEIPLAYVNITVGGAISLIDLRQFIYGPAVDRFFGSEAFSGFTADPAEKHATLDYWLFEPTAQNESIVLYGRVPDQYRGAIFRVWVFWTGTVAPGVNDQVVWHASVNCFAVGEDTANFIPDCTEFATGVLMTEDDLVITELTGGACVLIPNPGEMLRLSIMRVATDGSDNYANDAVLFGVRLKLA